MCCLFFVVVLLLYLLWCVVVIIDYYFIHHKIQNGWRAEWEWNIIIMELLWKKSLQNSSPTTGVYTSHTTNNILSYPYHPLSFRTPFGLLGPIREKKGKERGNNVELTDQHYFSWGISLRWYVLEYHYPFPIIMHIINPFRISHIYYLLYWLTI